MTLQTYYAQLIDGTTIVMVEDYYMPANQSLVRRYKSAQPDDILTIGDPTNGYAYVPKRNILCIYTGEVTNG